MVSGQTTLHGFTLVELLTTLAILAVIFLIGMPAMIGLVQENRMRTAANSLTLDFVYARSEAIKQVSPVVLCKSRDARSCAAGSEVTWADGWIAFVDMDRDNALTPGEPILLVRDKPPGSLKISAANFQNFIAFRPDGSSNNFGHFKIEDARGKSSLRLLCVVNTGRVRVQTTEPCSA